MATPKALQQRKEIEGAVFKQEIKVNDKISLIVAINEEVGELARNNIDNLLSVRKIPDASDISSSHPIVMEIYKREMAIYEDADVPSWIKGDGIKPFSEIVEIVKREVETWRSVVMTEGFIAALIDRAIISIDGEETNRKFFEYVKTESNFRYAIINKNIECDPVSQDFFDNTKVNARQLENGLPPIPKRNPASIVEQKIAIIATLRKTYGEFNIKIINFFHDYLDEIMKNIHEANLEDGEIDDDGFQSDGLDGDLDVKTDAKSKTRKRRKRTTGNKIPTSPGDGSA